jgi:hypothetical protein
MPYIGLRATVVDIEEKPVTVPLASTSENGGGGGGAVEAVTTAPFEETAIEGTLRPGVKYFISDAVALDLGVNFSVASESIYVNDGKIEDTDWGVSAGVRTYF